MRARQRKVHRLRRDLLKLFLVWPLPLAASRAQAAEEYVIVDGWVMKRTDLQFKNAR